MITVNNVVKEYTFGTDNKINALDGCSLVINDGEIVFVVGKSGSGKSTLLHIIGGLDKPTSGNVTYNEKEISSLSESALSLFRRDHVGYVFQEYNLVPELTAEENIKYPAMLQRKAVDKKLFNYLIETLELSNRTSHLPSQLSGGQQQRVAIARALMMDPKVVLCDEPTGNLDSKSSEAVQNILFSLNEELKKTIVIVTHDKEFSEKGGRIIEISDGRIV
ncbi:MAG: ABC transporter ATP-binding protein [Ruminiclostridium sp.]|nr:ABC transporter ATP-binding protein [Ruminiclostridium sp.]